MISNLYFQSTRLYLTFILFNAGTTEYANLDTLVTRASSRSNAIYYLANDDSLNRQDNSILNCHIVFLNENTGLLYAVRTDPERSCMH